MEKISVIVPVYNVEQYLDKCMESLVNQTNPNLEIWLIDDGSTDASAQICDIWKKKDSRICVVHKENGGQAEARNVGLDLCTSEYIVFVDSDDYVHEQYVEYLYGLITSHSADLAICEYRMTSVSGKLVNRFSDKGNVILMDQKKALWELCNESLYSSSPCAKIFRRSLFENIRFPVGHNFEDLATIYKLFLKSNKVVLGQRALYYYVQREGSTMTSISPWGKMDAVVYAEEMCRAITEKWPGLLHVAYKKLFMEYAYSMRFIITSGEKSERVRKTLAVLYKKAKSVRRFVWGNKLTPKMKFYLGSSYFGKSVFCIGLFLEVKLYALLKQK